jgi:N-acetylglucosamine kinase-like BadF-type ATPase
MTGGSNIVRLGEQQAREALHTAIRQACITAKISPSQIRAVCIGAAGAGRPETAAKIRGILEELIPGIPREKIEVAGDAVIALEAAFGAGSGVIAIAGTGSIVYGRDATGNVARAGGWGFAISDEGSGHWIGRRAIALAMTARDEGLETALTDGILQAWKFNTIDELVQRANATPPPDFPRLFRTVLLAADGGDAIARELLIDAGTKLAALAAIVVRRLAPEAEGGSPPAAPLTIAALPIAMTGSVFRQSPKVRQIFYDTLQKNFPGIDVRPDLVDPVEGALARAKRL